MTKEKKPTYEPGKGYVFDGLIIALDLEKRSIRLKTAERVAHMRFDNREIMEKAVREAFHLDCPVTIEAVSFPWGLMAVGIEYVRSERPV